MGPDEGRGTPPPSPSLDGTVQYISGTVHSGLAPKGLIALFSDGRRRPIVYYDAHGRSLCISGSDARNLFVIEEDDEFVGVEGEPEL